MLKRLLAFAVSMALIVGMAPTLVLADEAVQEPQEPATEATEDKEQEEASEEKVPDEEAKVSEKAKAAKVDPYVFNGSTMTINKNVPNYDNASEVPWKDYRNSITKVLFNSSR